MAVPWKAEQVSQPQLPVGHFGWATFRGVCNWQPHEAG
jgi:hypothetical protein